MRFADWQGILASPAPDDDLLYARGIWHYARGQAFNGLSQPEKAQQELADLAKIRRMPEAQDLRFFNREGAPVLLEIAETVLTGMIAANAGKLDSAMATLESAVVMEDSLPYTEPPEWFFPVRHILGAVQLEAGELAAAQATYERDLEIMVENGWGLRGLEKVLTLQGKTEQAQVVQDRFTAAWQHAEIDITGSVISRDENLLVESATGAE